MSRDSSANTQLNHAKRVYGPHMILKVPAW